jgi:hypothetical protein
MNSEERISKTNEGGIGILNLFDFIPSSKLSVDEFSSLLVGEKNVAHHSSYHYYRSTVCASNPRLKPIFKIARLIVC